MALPNSKLKLPANPKPKSLGSLPPEIWLTVLHFVHAQSVNNQGELVLSPATPLWWALGHLGFRNILLRRFMRPMVVRIDIEDVHEISATVLVHFHSHEYIVRIDLKTKIGCKDRCPRSAIKTWLGHHNRARRWSAIYLQVTYWLEYRKIEKSEHNLICMIPVLLRAESMMVRRARILDKMTSKGIPFVGHVVLDNEPSMGCFCGEIQNTSVWPRVREYFLHGFRNETLWPKYVSDDGLEILVARGYRRLEPLS